MVDNYFVLLFILANININKNYVLYVKYICIFIIETHIKNENIFFSNNNYK